MRPWRHVVIATATTAATALSFTNTHWDVWYADAFVISWNDNSTAVDLELFASGGNLTSDSARATIACLCFFFLFLFFSFLFCFICFQVWLVSLSLRYLVTLYYFSWWIFLGFPILVTSLSYSQLTLPSIPPNPHLHLDTPVSTQLSRCTMVFRFYKNHDHRGKREQLFPAVSD